MGECNAGEYLAGVAHSQGGPSHLLCCPGTSVAKTNCTTLTLSTSTNVPATHDYVGENWDVIGFPGANRPAGMATCVDGKYMMGVSRTPSTTLPKPHAIYCCSP